MVQYFVNFAASGNPNIPTDQADGSPLPEWKSLTSAEEIFELNENPGVIPEPYLELYRILDRMHGFTE